jgi:hypothetical protein
VLWHDPVRALAEATGARLDPAGEIDPGIRPSGEAEMPMTGEPGSATER